MDGHKTYFRIARLEQLREMESERERERERERDKESVCVSERE